MRTNEVPVVVVGAGPAGLTAAITLARQGVPTLVVERRAGKKRDRGTLKIGARRGRFARSYRFHSTGLFRFYVSFAGDKSNAATKSGAVYVRALPPASTGGGGVTAARVDRPR